MPLRLPCVNGYRNGRWSYTGILDKCPAVSYIDASVAEDIYGMEVKHREHYFSFNVGLYKSWTARAEIWLEDEVVQDERRSPGPGGRDESDTFAPGLPGRGVNEQSAEFCPGSKNNENGTERGTSSDTSFHHLPGTQNTKAETSDGSSCGCVSGSGENTSPACTQKSLISRSALQNSSPLSTSLRKDMQRRKKGAKSEKPFRVDPLPGLLDHRDFVRVKIPQDRCDICHEGIAVFRCVEKQIGVCEGCYAKMIREWNGKAGIHLPEKT